MGQKTKHILVLIQDLKHLNIAVAYSFTLAHIFKAEVAFAYFYGQYRKNFSLSAHITKNTNPNGIAFREIQLAGPELEPNYSIQQLNAIFLVTQFPSERIKHYFKKNPIFKWLLDAKIPTLLLSENTKTDCSFKNIFVPVDHRRESKEKMIWASYFGRFNHAVVHLVASNEKYLELQQRVRATLLFTNKMYKQFSFKHKTIMTNSNSNGVKAEAYKISKKMDSDLIVLMSHPNNTWLTSYFGSWELKKLLHKEANPILFINPVKDYYLPCD